jgi:hypothetical protein
MTRGTFVLRNGKIVEKGGPLDVRPAPQRSGLPAPMLISDTMEPTQHPCTGEYFSSKAKFRSVTRANGCVEVGNDPARLRTPPKPKPDRRAIRQSVEKAFAQYESGVRPVAN